MTLNKRIWMVGILAAVILAIVIFFHNSPNADTPMSGASPAAPPVTVAIVTQKPMQLWKEFSGRLQAVDYVELRPEVSGKITKIHFIDGQKVTKGDVLLVIDPSPYQAAVDKARADFLAAKNQYALAQKDWVRAQDLIKTETIPKRVFDERENSVLVAKNQIDSAAAQLKKAEIDLDHAYVKAPISGRISRAEITEGNFVQANVNAPVLTTIVSDQGIYADFDVDEQTYLQNIYKLARDSESQVKIPVEMVLKSGSDETYKGVIQSFDNKIDSKSGTIRVRAFFENSDQALLPGMFVNVRLGGAGTDNVMLVSEKAIGTDQNRKFVYVVNNENKVVYREVKLGSSINGQRVVLSGLQDGEKVITEGVMKIRPDMMVLPQPEAAAADVPDATSTHQ